MAHPILRIVKLGCLFVVRARSLAVHLNMATSRHSGYVIHDCSQTKAQSAVNKAALGRRAGFPEQKRSVLASSIRNIRLSDIRSRSRRKIVDFFLQFFALFKEFLLCTFELGNLIGCR